MDILQMILTVVLVIVSLVLIISVLMHSGKSAGLSGSIAGGAEALFGKTKGRSYDALFDKITTVSAILFMVITLALVWLQ